MSSVKSSSTSTGETHSGKTRMRSKKFDRRGSTGIPDGDRISCRSAGAQSFGPSSVRGGRGTKRSRMPGVQLGARQIKNCRQRTRAIEALTNFSTPARYRWETISASIRQRLLANIRGGQCRHEVTITNFISIIKGSNLRLVCRCAE